MFKLLLLLMLVSCGVQTGKEGATGISGRAVFKAAMVEITTHTW